MNKVETVVILAAGRGKRLIPLTNNKPKCLVEYIQGRSIFENTIDNLPDTINHIILVVHYFEDLLVAKAKSLLLEKKGVRLSVVRQSILNGTFDALLSCREILNKKEKFLVLSGDDLYDKSELEKMIDSGATLALQKKKMPPRYLVANTNESFCLGLRVQTDEDLREGALCITGAYLLDSSVFDLELKENFQGEIGIPQTLFSKKSSCYKFFLMENWFPINTISDIEFYRKKGA